jgi:hypothetical protein
LSRLILVIGTLMTLIFMIVVMIFWLAISDWNPARTGQARLSAAGGGIEH